jgi:hypothetical protein
MIRAVILSPARAPGNTMGPGAVGRVTQHAAGFQTDTRVSLRTL